MLILRRKNMSNICLCNKVTKETIVLAVKNGAKTYEEVKEATGAGKGSCKGANCSYMINELIKKHKESDNS